MSKKVTTEEFIERSINSHTIKYDYSKSEYVNARTYINIICVEHGVFSQRPIEHMNGANCPKCAGREKVTIKEFIKRASLKHNNKFNYSLVEFSVLENKVKIICPIHGIFEQKAVKHLSGDGCIACSGNKKLTKDEFIQRALIVHGDKYNYSKVAYKGHAYKINIICNIHGFFTQGANKHLSGDGCPECAEENKGWSFSNWEKAGLNSSRFEGFKFYIIECWNENEHFYKIGKTFNNISRRYKTKIKMPYSWKVIKLEEGDARTISKMEIEFKHLHKKFRYTPIINFKGVSECYNNI
jgi:hypothetical protein